MSTVAQLIDRAFREWLAPPDEQPARFTLSAAISTTSATSFTVDTTLLSSEEELLLGPGTVVELERELIQIGAYDEDTNIASSCIRGISNTTAATHASGTAGVITPKYSRQAVFDTICDEVENLWPDLAKIVEDSSRTFTTTTFTEIPATVMEPMYVWARPAGSTSPNWGQYSVNFLDHFPPSSTGKAATLTGPYTSMAGYLVYKAKFTRPTSEADELTTTCGLQDEWERIVLLGTVGYLIAAKDLSPIEQRFLSEQLADQGFPVGSGARIWSAIRTYREDLLDKAQKALRQREPVTIVSRSVFD